MVKINPTNILNIRRILFIKKYNDFRNLQPLKVLCCLQACIKTTFFYCFNAKVKLYSSFYCTHN